MKRRKLVPVGALLILLGLSWIGSGWATVFDDLEPSPRARAMGGAFTGLADDGCALFYNPAGLSQIGDYQLYSSYQRLFGMDFFAHTVGNLVVPLRRWGTVGVSYQSFGVEYKGVDMESEKTFQVGHGFRVMGDIHSTLAFGYALNMYSLEFGRSVGGVDLGSTTTFGVDVAALATLRGRVQVGFLAKNINRPQVGQEEKEDLPQRVVVGVAYRPYDGVVTVWDVEKKLNEDTQFLAGAEAEILKHLCLRFGIKSRPNMYAMGFGLHHLGVYFDYAFTHFNELSGTHQFSLSYRFGE